MAGESSTKEEEKEDFEASSSLSAATPIQTMTIWLLGVSGGCDSIALFHLLRHYFLLLDLNKADHNDNTDTDTGEDQPQPQLLHVVHFDHQQRGRDSNADRELVVQLCHQYNIPCHVYYWNNHHNHHHPMEDTTSTAQSTSHHHHHRRKSQTFTQETARKWRKTTMQQTCDAILRDARANHPPGTQVKGILLTAHHLDDSNETLLLKLLRGTHITHLQGMDMITACSVDNDYNDAAADADAAAAASEEQQQQQQQQHQHHHSGTINNNMIWARPLLTVPKSALVKYLQQHNYTWRDDASNTSDKYLRNRIRNELIPLLNDLVGGDSHGGNEDGTTILQKRFNHLSQQSRDVEQHLNQLAYQYLRDSQSLKDDSVFPIPTVLPLDVVAQQALHLWIVQTADTALRRRNSTTTTTANSPRAIDCSYEQLQRLCRQLHEYPHNHQWRLDMGHQWSVAREGTILRLHHPRCTPQVAPQPTERELCWTVLDHTTPSDETLRLGYQSNALILRLPTSRWTNNSSFVATTMSDAGALFFRPSWRDKALPLKDFLRGQKVPLHQRGQSPIILWHSRQDNGENTTPLVAAVYVPSKQSWCVAYECSTLGESDLENAVSIRVELGSGTRFD